MDDLKERRRYWNLKEEALVRNAWARFGIDCGPVTRLRPGGGDNDNDNDDDPTWKVHMVDIF